MKLYFLLWLISTATAAGIGWSVGRMTAPDIKAAYMIECSPEQMERVRSLAGEYRADGESVISALARARLEVCL